MVTHAMPFDDQRSGSAAMTEAAAGAGEIRLERADGAALRRGDDAIACGAVLILMQASGFVLACVMVMARVWVMVALPALSRGSRRACAECQQAGSQDCIFHWVVPVVPAAC